MEVTMVGLQNAGKTSLLRVLAVCSPPSVAFRGCSLTSSREESLRSSEFPLRSSSAADIRKEYANAQLCSSIPTVGFNMKRVQRGHVTLKCWDIGGQPRFRNMWERYCRGVNAIVFIVDIAEPALIPQAKEELHALMSNQSLLGIPLLVLGNKSDLPQRMSVDELIDELDLKSIQEREVCCYGISAKEETNLDAVVQFLMKYASR
jgi:ADP-ribosylation factor-like protein 8